MLPVNFRVRYRNVNSIIGCFEVVIEKAADSVKEALTSSEYYKANTIEFLVSSTPDGIVNFISKGYTTDKIIKQNENSI